ncbi:DUF3397 domain-containing protein [Pseudolactococcus hodotermopsidis]|uniref:DUF3397 domain-containing protein n=1 Tax=Pseudolactococcus hodotermopsidis TaxID=2709157 RepID=UPI001556C127|nr:DUF3397 domain-containing protein [Lactococcus hodotermopsidis]
MLTNILIALYPLIIFIGVAFIFNFFHIRKHLPINVPDIVTFFLIFGLHKFSRLVTHISILPYFLLLISAMALILLLLDLLYYREFYAQKFIKLFWRTTFFITLILYLAMTVVIFTA